MKRRNRTYTLPAFTIIEIMTALVIFSGSMLAYLGYQASVSKVLYDAQSASMAGHLAEDFVQAIDTLDNEAFKNLVESFPLDNIMSDNSINSSTVLIRSFQNPTTDTDAFTGPFTPLGIPLYGSSAPGNGLFFRHIRINTYGAETNNSGLTIEQLYFYYYHVEIIVSWPRTNAPPATRCTALTNTQCDQLHIHFLRGTR